jgi:hypothetical protein
MCSGKTFCPPTIKDYILWEAVCMLGWWRLCTKQGCSASQKSMWHCWESNPSPSLHVVMLVVEIPSLHSVSVYKLQSPLKCVLLPHLVLSQETKPTAQWKSQICLRSLDMLVKKNTCPCRKLSCLYTTVSLLTALTAVQLWYWCDYDKPKPNYVMCRFVFQTNEDNHMNYFEWWITRNLTIIIIIIITWRYSPMWASASCAIRLHWSPSFNPHVS